MKARINDGNVDLNIKLEVVEKNSFSKKAKSWRCTMKVPPTLKRAEERQKERDTKQDNKIKGE